MTKRLVIDTESIYCGKGLKQIQNKVKNIENVICP